MLKTKGNSEFGPPKLFKPRGKRKHYRNWLQLSLTFGFFFLLAIVTVGVSAIVNLLGKPLLIRENQRLIESSGNKIVSDLLQHVQMTEALTATLAAAGTVLEPDEEKYKTAIPAIMDFKGHEALIAGGGLWPEPYTFTPGVERRSFFWGRRPGGTLKYFDDYNHPEGKGYHNEEWYVPAKYIPAGEGFWSKSYMDPYSYQPMVTCTVPMKKDGAFLGVATIDLKLEGLHAFFQRAAARTGGYAFAVDRNNKFLSFPDEKPALSISKDAKGKLVKEFIYAAALAQKEPLFAPLAESLERINRNIITSAMKSSGFSEALPARINSGSYQINAAEANLIAAIMQDPLKESTVSTNKLEQLTLPDDLILKEPVIVTIFHMPRTYWKAVIVTPVETATAGVNQVTAKVFYYLVAVLALLFTATFLLIRWGLTLPLKKMTGQLKKIEEHQSDLSLTLDIPSRNELGELGHLFNLRSRQLRRTRQYLNNIIESMPSMLISIDATGTVTQWNHAAATYTGINAGDAMEKKLWEIVPNFARFEKYLREILSTRVPREFPREKFVNGDNIRYHNVSLYPLVEDGLKGMVLRMDDVTELEKKDQQLRQSQKMETVGTLAGGLAHDFNNVLGGVVGTISLLKYKLNKGKIQVDEEAVEMLDLIEESGQRAGDMVQQLLALARQQEMTFSPVDLNHTVKNVIKICKNTIDKGIELNPLYYTEEALVNADPTQLEQMLLNLCVNSSHAMTFMREEDEPRGGKLTIALERIFADRHFRQSHPEAKGAHYWVLAVRDTGVGMDSRTQSKAFDPFYTTKEKGKGTGLGLAMVYNIVQQHKGFIDMYSEIGTGTTINVFLPILESGKSTGAKAPREELPRGEGLILVADDEPVMRRLARSILEESGYRVLLAKNGLECVSLYAQHQGEIKMVLLDMAMPVKSGDEAFKEMKAMDGNVKVLLASGFRKDERVDKILAAGAARFIQKPYTLEKLSKTVYEIINSTNVQ